MVDLIRVYIDQGGTLKTEFSLWLLAAVLVAVGVAGWIRRRRLQQQYRPVEVEIALGGIGRVRFQPNTQDRQIAHRIWVELVTRKAALPLDEEHDVILEIYESWYQLFQNVRKHLGDLPSELVHSEESTREIVRIATETLNRGLRPHLTRWYARLSAWHARTRDQATEKTPQEWQRDYPHYADLVGELRVVNQQLLQYASALERIVSGQ